MSPALPLARTSTKACVSAADIRWDRSSCSTTSASTPRSSSATHSMRSTLLFVTRRRRSCAAWSRRGISGARAAAGSTSTRVLRRTEARCSASVGALARDRRWRLALHHVQVDAGEPHSFVPELRGVGARFSKHRLQDRDRGDAHLLTRLELGALGLELKVGGGDHELGVGVHKAELDLPCLADVAGAETKARHHRKCSLARELGQGQRAEATTQDVALPSGGTTALSAKKAKESSIGG